jgi:hypothetical protein
VRPLGISWLELPASRRCTALLTDNSLPDRSNSTRSGWRKADCNRSSHNLDKSPTTDNHCTSTPVPERPTTSHSARHASHGTSGPRASRRRHYVSPRSRRRTRRRRTRRRGTSTVETPSAAVPPAPAPMRCLGETRLAENSRPQQYGCNAHDRPRLAGPGFARRVRASITPCCTRPRKGTQATQAGF